VFLVPTAILMHGFWRDTEPQAKRMEQVQFFKDLGLAGAALMLFALFAHV
jgi:putative oxidoreductase